jgi:hypothetical protein
MESGNFEHQQALNKKAFEISYALVRVAGTNPANPSSPYLHRLGLEVLYAVTLERHAEALTTLRSIEYFVRLAGSTDAMTSRNSELISEEANNLHSAILGVLDGEKNRDVDLSEIFSGDPIIKGDLGRSAVMEDIPEAPVEHPAALFKVSEDSNIRQRAKSLTHLNPASIMRQSAILEKIRQSGNLPGSKMGCRMKEIQDAFPHVSERTLRYDIQAILEQGLIERVGQSGPATFYRARVVSRA